jgi:hypothetical protein
MTSFGDIPALGEYVGSIHQEIALREAYPFSCGLIAIDIAEILRDHGHMIDDLRVLDLRGEEIGTTGNRSPLVPRRFGETVSWGAHLVCVSGGTAYDPIISSPIPFDTYRGETFTTVPEIYNTFEGQRLEELIARRSLAERIISQNSPQHTITIQPQL